MSTLGFNEDSGDAKDNIDALKTTVQAKQTKIEEEQWSVSVSGKNIVFREYTESIVGMIQTAGDIAVQFSPPQAAVPWSVVKGLLNVCFRCSLPNT